jgi:outer membrane protein TolC
MKRLIIFFLFLLSFVNAFSQQKINLGKCIELSESNHPQASQLPLIHQSAELQVRLLNSNYLPQSSIGGQATWQSEVTSVPISLPNFSISPPPKDQYKATLDVVQNIWDGGVLQKQKEATLAGAKVDEQRIHTDLYQVKEQVSNLYFGALFAEKQINNALILQKDLESKLDKTKASVANGIAIKSNQMMIEARILEINQQIFEAKSRKNAALEALSILTGQKMDDQMILEVPTNNLELAADIHRPELVLFQKQKDLLGVNEEMAKAKNLPKISAFATGGYGKPGLNFLANEFKTYFMGGVQLKVPLSFLYSGSQTNEIQQIKISQQKIDTQKDAFLMNTKLRLSNQTQEIGRLAELVKTDVKLVEIREQIRKTAEAQLDNGVITASDYLTELNNEDMAKQNSILHEIQLLQARFNLKIISGNLR